VFLNGDIAEKISKIKQQEGPDLHVYGSANLVQTLLKHDLVDAFWLKIYPITLGGGKRLFAHGTIPAAFKVTESPGWMGDTALIDMAARQGQSSPGSGR
jgi:dihydrofolate reductase